MTASASQGVQATVALEAQAAEAVLVDSAQAPAQVVTPQPRDGRGLAVAATAAVAAAEEDALPAAAMAAVAAADLRVP